MVDQILLDFLRSQRLLVLATADEKPAVTNLYYVVDENGMIYFISNETTLHCQQILKRPDVAFSVAWYNLQNHKDRKGVQGTGVCSKVTSRDEIAKIVQMHNEFYPEFADHITVDWITGSGSRLFVWIIQPLSTKFWNDDIYGAGETDFPSNEPY